MSRETYKAYRSPNHSKGTDNESLRVKEMFTTIQGEGPLAGEPCVFIRLEGCNLKCFFCDTDFEDGEIWRVGHIVRKVADMRPEAPLGVKPLVVITGGEPLAQPIGTLVTSLLGNKYRVQIETAGTLWTELPEHPDLDIICSPKTPKVHPTLHQRATGWKYLVRALDPVDKDGLPMMKTQGKTAAGDWDPIEGDPPPLAKPKPHVPVFLQPVEEDNDPRESDRNLAKATRLCLKHGFRLSIQQHKIIGLP